MAKVPNGVETLLKISTGWVGHTDVTDRRQTDERQHTANMNVSSLFNKCWPFRRPSERAVLADGCLCVVSLTSSVGLITGSAYLIHACVWCSLIDRRTKAAAFCSQPNVYSSRSAPIEHVSSNCWSCVHEVDGVKASHLHLQSLSTFYPLHAFITISLRWCTKTETGYFGLKTEPNQTEFEKSKPTQP